jgi:hypothetical protein
MSLMWLLAPRLAPAANTWLNMAAMMGGCFALGAVGFFFLAILQRRPVILPIAGLLAIYFLLRMTQPFEEPAWIRRFEAMHAERAEIIAFMRQQSNIEAYTPVQLPAHLAHVADRGLVIGHRDEHGRVYYGFAVFTTGIDNSTGFVFSESGHPPPRRAYPEITSFRGLGGGWYLFRST